MSLAAYPRLDQLSGLLFHQDWTTEGEGPERGPQLGLRISAQYGTWTPQAAELSRTVIGIG